MQRKTLYGYVTALPIAGMMYRSNGQCNSIMPLVVTVDI